MGAVSGAGLRCRIEEQDAIPDLSQGFMRMAEHDCSEPSFRGMDGELRAIV
jgi:hypothetical protein